MLSLSSSSSLLLLLLIVLPSAQPRNSLPHDFCPLPAKFGYKGSTKLVEECENLDIFKELPVPGAVFQKYGQNPVVCCPKINKTPIQPICFPNQDIGCPENNNNHQADQQRRNGNQPKLSLEDCSAYHEYWGNTTQCVNLKDCPGIFNKPFNPSRTKNPVNAKVCGWDDADKALKICCPFNLTQVDSRPAIEPRFPGKRCEDKVKHCQQWRNNGACSLDTDFNIGKDYKVSNSRMFDFMTGACMKACGRCGEKGCRDEHKDCKEWAEKGFCITRAKFMVHTCRESCGVCGFLSQENTEDQIVGGQEYTDIKSTHFDCGRYNESDSEGSSSKSTIKRTGLADILSSLSSFHSIPLAIEAYPVASISSGESDSAFVVPKPEVLKFCGSTLISDRWLLTAAHCYDEFQPEFYKQPVKAKIVTIRNDKKAEETIEIKRVFSHPHYTYPELYNDIALLELSRRVDYNWEKYGDTPMCLDRDGRNEGKEATIEGFGRTAEGTVGDLKQVRVKVIDNVSCRTFLNHNATRSRTVREKIRRSFSKGFNGNVLCAQGIVDQGGIIRNSCQGDGGAPLFVTRDDGRYKMVGIVSGGISCGKGFPGWFTKVQPFTPWIDCIVEKSKMEKSQERIENACQDIANEVQNEAYDGDIFTTDEGDELN